MTGPNIGTPADGRLLVVTSPPRPDGRPKLWVTAGSEHKRPIQWVGVGGRLNSLRPPEINGWEKTDLMVPIRSKHLYARLLPAGVIFDRRGVAGGDAVKGRATAGEQPASFRGEVP